MDLLEKYEAIIRDIRQRLQGNEKRFRHIEGVAVTSAVLALIHGEDMERAFLAGLLHDAAKYYPDEARIAFCEEKGIEISEAERKNPGLLHAKMGAYISAADYGIQDPEILSAIRYHTTGRPEMTLLEKIVFVADYIEPTRKNLPLLDELRVTGYRDLNLAVAMMAENTVHHVKEKGEYLDKMSEETYRYYIGIINNRSHA